MHRRPTFHHYSSRGFDIRVGAVTCLPARLFNAGSALIQAYRPCRVRYETAPAFDPLKGRLRTRLC